MTRPPNPRLVESLLAITAGLVAENGAESVTLREVAERAGVSTTTVHYYFADRGGLLEAARRRAVQELDAAVGAAAEASAGAVERVTRIAEAFAGWSLGDPHSFALVFDAPPGQPPGRAAPTCGRTPALLRSALEQGVRSGALHVDDVDLAATLGFATMFGVVRLCLSGRLPPGRQGDPTTVLRAAVEGFLRTCAEASPPDGHLRLMPSLRPRRLDDDELDGLAAAGLDMPPGPETS